MRIQKQVTQLTPPEEEQFHEYLEQKLERIRKFVEKHFPDDDTAKMDVRMIRHEKHTAFEFEVVLSLPGFSPFVSKEVKHSVTEPMDLVFDRIDHMVHKEFDKRRQR